MREERLIEEFREPPTICCGTFNAAKCYRRLSKAMVFFDISMVVLSWFVIFTFLFGTDAGHFQTDYIIEYSKSIRSEIERHFVYIMLPNLIVLHFKTYAGLRWIKSGYSRPTYQSYYTLSISMYCSFSVQETLLIISTWNVFTTFINGSQVFLTIASIPAAIILTLNMRFLDRQNLSVNLIKKKVR